MSTPRISVGLPVYNGAKHLAASIDSVLWQTEKDFELIISDNASTDDTQRICEQYAARDKRVIYHRKPVNVGLSRNFNGLFPMARGKYFKWHAHDDIMMPAYMERCAEQLDEHPDLVMAYPRRRWIRYEQVLDPAGDWMKQAVPDREESHPDPSYAQLLLLPGLLAPKFLNGLIRPAALAKTRLLGAYPHSDTVLVPELRLQGPFAEVPEVLFYVRSHDQSDAMWRARQGWAAEAVYIDPSNKGKPSFPSARKWWEQLRAVLHSDIGHAEKRTALLTLARVVGQKVTGGALKRRLVSRRRSVASSGISEGAQGKRAA